MLNICGEKKYHQEIVFSKGDNENLFCACINCQKQGGIASYDSDFVYSWILENALKQAPRFMSHVLSFNAFRDNTYPDYCHILVTYGKGEETK